MLKIKIDNEEVILGKNTSIPLILSSPIVNDDMGSHSFNFSLPNDFEKKNAKLLGHLHRAERSSSFVNEHAILLEFGPIIKSGTIKTSDANNENLTNYVLIDDGDFISKAKALNIRDADFGDDIDLTTEPGATGYIIDKIIYHAKKCCEEFYPNRNYCFPVIYNELFYDTANNPDYDDFVNDYDLALQKFVNLFDTDGLSRNTLVPQVYLFYIIKKILQNMGFLHSGNFFLDDELAKLIVYNNFALDKNRQFFYFQGTGPGLSSNTIELIPITIELHDDYNLFANNKYLIKSEGWHDITIQHRSTKTGT